MKKRYFIGGTLAVALCVIVLCAFAANESADVPEAAATGQQTATTVSRSGGKVLVAYFSIPETDGVDASSGASRLVSDGKLQGNTEMWPQSSVRLPAAPFRDKDRTYLSWFA